MSFIVALSVVFAKDGSKSVWRPLYEAKGAKAKFPNSTFYWRSNNAGLYSHFFQVKYIHHLASKWNRDLVILPYKSIHTNDLETINLCEIFEWEVLKIRCESPYAVRIEVINNVSVEVKAPSNKTFKKCVVKIRPEKDYSEIQHLCFKGLVWGPSFVIPQQLKMDIMEYAPRLIFKEKYQDLFNSIKTTYTSFIHTKLDAESALHDSTVACSAEEKAMLSIRVEVVVHWRRGDQLQSRCAHAWTGLRDFSVNCATAIQLVQAVQTQQALITLTGSRINATHVPSVQEWKRPVLVATNEANETILDELRAHRFYPIMDLMRHHCLYQTGSCKTTGLSSLEEFIVESQFMTDAPTFISYGISQVNDVIEYERMKQGRSWCSQSNSAAVKGSVRHKRQQGERNRHSSWCDDMRSIPS